MFCELLDDGDERQLFAVRLASSNQCGLEFLLIGPQRSLHLLHLRLGGLRGAPGLGFDLPSVVHRLAGGFLFLLGLRHLRLELHLRIRELFPERVAVAARGGGGVLRRPRSLRVTRRAFLRETFLAGLGVCESLLRSVEGIRRLPQLRPEQLGSLPRGHVLLRHLAAELGYLGSQVLDLRLERRGPLLDGPDDGQVARVELGFDPLKVPFLLAQ